MKHLLTATAVLELGAGLALLSVPTLLFGPAIDTPTGSTVARVAGAALLAIGVACWLARHDGQSHAANGLVGGLLVYNALVAAVLIYAGTALRLSSGGLWPAAAIHAAMTVWCMTSLLGRKSFSMRTPLSLWCLAGLLLLAVYPTDVPAAGADATAGLRILTAENPPLNFSQDGEIKGLFQWVGPLATQDTNLYVLKGSGIEIANLDQARQAGRIATVAK